MTASQIMPRITLLTLIFSSLLLVACTTVETQSFRATGNSNVDASYIATDADFSQYHRLLIDDMGIFFPENAPMSRQDQTRIRQIFRESFMKELSGYDITQEPGPGMLQVTASLVDLRNATTADVPDMRASMSNIAQPGALLFMMELKDSGTNRVLARAGDSTTAPQFATAENRQVDWTSVESAAAHWASIFRAFLDQNLGK